MIDSNCMRIFFISPFCLLRPTTNRIFDVRFCDMMAGAGVDVTIIHPYYFMKENISEDAIEKNYGLLSSVKFKMLRTPLNVSSSRWWQRIVLLTSFFFMSIRIIFSSKKEIRSSLIIGRDNKALLPAVALKKIFGKLVKVKLVNTVHEVKEGKFNQWMYRSYDALLVTTASAKEKLVNSLQISEAKIERLVSPVSKANYLISKSEARKKINYSDTKPLVVYSGKLGKGITELDFIIDAAATLPQYNFILTGGKLEAVNYFKEVCENKNIRNITFPGFINDSTFISYYQLAADALISYYTKEDHTVEYNFPQKLIEYMYSHNPIVTPDFPATHDVINSSNAIIVEPDNVFSFVEGIKKAVEDRDASKRLAEKAFTDVQLFSNEGRAEQWLNFFNKL